MKYNILLIVGLIGGTLYVLLYNALGSFFLDFLIKPVPIWCIAIYSFLKKNYLITVGLLFGSLGDIFLTNTNEIFFMLGLGSFFIGHIFYIINFINNSKFNKKGLLISLFILLFSIIVSYWILPNLPQDLKIPVILYILIITTMVITTAFYKYFNYYVILGAILFLISDTIIALNKFVNPITNASLFIMILYYLGQWGITYGGCKK